MGNPSILRNAADGRTLFWTLGLVPAVAVLHFVQPAWSLWFLPVSMYLALACGVIAHNHNHCPTFRSKKANVWFGNWISIFYGYPVFAWIPTHNLNHHKFVNRAGDATITWRFTNRHISPVALTYFFVSSYFQSGPINEFIRNAKAKNPGLYRRVVSQYLIFVGAHISLFLLASTLYGWGAGFMLWLFAFGIPAFFALWTIMLFNYEQHVHTDPWSEHDHSRSFSSPLLNFLLFNNGYHAAHHEKPGMHWSQLKAEHDRIAPLIDARLIERSWWWYLFRQYVLAMFFPKLGSTQLGRAPFDDGEAKSLEHGAVGLGDMGTNQGIA